MCKFTGQFYTMGQILSQHLDLSFFCVWYHSSCHGRPGLVAKIFILYLAIWWPSMSGNTGLFQCSLSSTMFLVWNVVLEPFHVSIGGDSCAVKCLSLEDCIGSSIWLYYRPLSHVLGENIPCSACCVHKWRSRDRCLTGGFTDWLLFPTPSLTWIGFLGKPGWKWH